MACLFAHFSQDVRGRTKRAGSTKMVRKRTKSESEMSERERTDVIKSNTKTVICMFPTDNDMQVRYQ